MSEERAWLFINGDQSVRLIRRLMNDGTCQLLVEGPAEAQESRSCPDIAACIGEQSGIEQRLRALGFHLEGHTSDRRAR